MLALFSKDITLLFILIPALAGIAYVIGYLLLMRRNTKQEKTSTTAIFPRTQLEFKKFFRKISGWLFAFCFLIGLALELAPMVSILVNSFIKTSTGQFTLENYAGIFSFESIAYVNTSIPRAILNTFLFAIGGACFADSPGCNGCCGLLDHHNCG